MECLCGKESTQLCPFILPGEELRVRVNPFTRGHKVHLWQRKAASPLFYSVALMMTFLASCS